MPLGTNIKTIRTAKKMRQKELAIRLGITHNYLSMIENNSKTPSVGLLERLAKALETPLHILFADLTIYGR